MGAWGGELFSPRETIMPNPYAVRPVGGAAENGQSGSYSVSKPANAQNSREGQGAGSDFLFELNRLVREDAPELLSERDNARGREFSTGPQRGVGNGGAVADTQNSGLPVIAQSAVATILSAEAALTGAAQNAESSTVAEASQNDAAAVSESSGQNLPPHAGSFKLETRKANVTAAYNTIQDRARPSTALAPWGTGISYLA